MSDDIAADVTEAVRDVGGHPIVENGARVGYAVNGIVHLLIAWIAIQLALQPSAPRKAEGQETVDQSGALATLASSGLGKVTLLIAVGGFALLALWQVTEAVIRRKTSVRLKSAAKGIVYASLAWSAFAFVRGAGSSSSEQTVDVTAELMNRPLGQALVAILGFVVLGIGGYHVYKGAKCRFLHDLREHPGQWAVFAGRYGYIAKGVALALVAFSIFLYHSGKGYTLIFDNRNITLGEKSYKAPEYVQVTLDGKGRPLEIMGGDRDIMTVMGKKHVLKVDILSDDEETVMATIERPFTVRYDGGNLLNIPAFLSGDADWNQRIELDIAPPKEEEPAQEAIPGAEKPK